MLGIEYLFKHNHLPVSYTHLDVYKRQDICSAEIPSVDITERPCYYAGAGKVKGSYVRVGDADLPMTDYEIYSYEAFKKHVHDDERPIERATFDLLRKEELEKYILTTVSYTHLSSALISLSFRFLK